jgi:hypothetical protein
MFGSIWVEIYPIKGGIMNPLEVFMKKIEQLLNKSLDKKGGVDTRTLTDLFDLRTNIQTQINQKKSLDDLRKYYHSLKRSS